MSTVYIPLVKVHTRQFFTTSFGAGSISSAICTFHCRSGGASRKGSVITGSDTGSESDSQPPTAGNSMLDVSRRSSKRRSSSRASIGSKAARAKILRLSAPQKCGIAAKEMERIERELADFRLASRKKSAEAMAEIDERALRLEELKLSKARVVKVLAKAKVTRHDEEHYDYDKVAHCLKGDVDAHERHLEKLRTKNGVVASRIRKRLSGMRLEQSASDESGPVDLEQLQLENANLAAELERQNEAVIRLRKEMAAARRRKTAYQRDLGAQVERSGRLAREREAVKSEAQVVSANVKQVARNTRAAERRTARLSALLEKYEAPTTDDYMEVKWREMRLAEKEKVARRREHLERLKSSVERQRRRRARSASVRGGRAAPSATVMKGRTFNIEFRTVHQLADELKSGLQI